MLRRPFCHILDDMLPQTTPYGQPKSNIKDCGRKKCGMQHVCTHAHICHCQCPRRHINPGMTMHRLKYECSNRWGQAFQTVILAGTKHSQVCPDCTKKLVEAKWVNLNYNAHHNQAAKKFLEVIWVRLIELLCSGCGEYLNNHPCLAELRGFTCPATTPLGELIGHFEEPPQTIIDEPTPISQGEICLAMFPERCPCPNLHIGSGIKNDLSGYDFSRIHIDNPRISAGFVWAIIEKATDSLHTPSNITFDIKRRSSEQLTQWYASNMGADAAATHVYSYRHMSFPAMRHLYTLYVVNNPDISEAWEKISQSMENGRQPSHSIGSAVTRSQQ
jgi:hypothetical protein